MDPRNGIAILRITQVDADAQVRALMAILEGKETDHEGSINGKATVQPVAQE